MPFVFAIAGIVLVVAGVRGTVTSTNPNLVTLLKSDLTGSPNYLEWIAAIGIIGAIGYIPALRTFSRLFMGLVVIGLLLANRGFFAQFAAQTTSTDANISPITIDSPSITGNAATSPTSTGAPSNNLTLPDVLSTFTGIV